jgi:hypothetical protein
MEKKKGDSQVTIQWWHITRSIGVVVFLYGVFLDDSPERGTIILTGAGLAGFDKVARSDGPTKKDTDKKPDVK